MGTNEAFGGSGSAQWEKVRQEWAELGGDGPAGEPAADDGEGEAENAAYDRLVAALAQALAGEDKDARRPLVPSVPLTAALPPVVLAAAVAQLAAVSAASQAVPGRAAGG